MRSGATRSIRWRRRLGHNGLTLERRRQPHRARRHPCQVPIPVVQEMTLLGRRGRAWPRTESSLAADRMRDRLGATLSAEGTLSYFWIVRARRERPYIPEEAP